MTTLAWPTALLCLVTLACSASDTCPDAQPMRTVNTGSADLDALLYESAPWQGPFQPFPANSEISFVHHLGLTPQIVNTYLSFDQSASPQHNVAENAGNSALITCVDAEVIHVRNDTCEGKWFIRVVATATPAAPTTVHCPTP